MAAPSILAFAGSARGASFNRRLLRVAVPLLEAAGATVDTVELGELKLPLFDADLEKAQGVPAEAVDFRRKIAAADGMLLVCPEYNSSITPLLKNTIDWASRPVNGERHPFGGKGAALLSASPGALGGSRGLVVVRGLLTTLGVHVIPTQASVSRASEAFGEGDVLADEVAARRVQGVCEAFVRFLEKHRE